MEMAALARTLCSLPSIFGRLRTWTTYYYYIRSTLLLNIFSPSVSLSLHTSHSSRSFRGPSLLSAAMIARAAPRRLLVITRAAGAPSLSRRSLHRRPARQHEAALQPDPQTELGRDEIAAVECLRQLYSERRWRSSASHQPIALQLGHGIQREKFSPLWHPIVSSGGQTCSIHRRQRSSHSQVW